MRCKHWDSGWCYAPEGVATNAKAGGCYDPLSCEGRVEIRWPEPALPPINLHVLPSAENFYSDGTYVQEEFDFEE